MSIDLRPFYREFFKRYHRWLVNFNKTDPQIVAKFIAEQKRIEMESHFQHCHLCDRRLPKEACQQKDRVCIFCLAELNGLPEVEEPERVECGIDKYSSSPNGLPKTHFLEEEKMEPPGHRKDPFDSQLRFRIEEDSPPTWDCFIIYGDTP